MSKEERELGAEETGTADEKKYPDKDRGDIRLRGVPASTGETLKNIAKNLGIKTHNLIKKDLHKIIDSYPEHMKRPPLPY